MTDIGALLFAIWVTANFCAILYCVQADWVVGRQWRSFGRMRRW